MPTRSPFEEAFGTLDGFADHIRAEVSEGFLDRRDMLGNDGEGGVLRAIISWHCQSPWGR